MPLPSPKGTQDKGSFIGKCMSDPVMKKEFTDSKQRAAVCHSKWKKASGEIIMDFTDQIKQLEADKKAGYPPNCNKGYKEKGGKCVLIKKRKKAKGAKDNKLTPDEFEKVFEWVKKVGAYSHKVIDIRPEKKEVVIDDFDGLFCA